MASVPRVVTIAGTRPYATRRPLIAPSPAPIPSAIAITRAGDMPGSLVRIVPDVYATTPTMEPTDRSMLRVRTTRVCPTATTATTATLVLTRVKVRPDR